MCTSPASTRCSASSERTSSAPSSSTSTAIPSKRAGGAANGDGLSEPDGDLPPVGDDRGDAAALEGGQASPERVHPCAGTAPRHREASSTSSCRLMPRAPSGNASTRRFTPSPSAMATRPSCDSARRHFAEDAGELASAHQDVVRPLEPGAHSGRRRQCVDERQPGGEGHARRDGGGAAEQDRHEQRRPGRRAPCPALTPPAGRLLVRDAAQSLAGTRPSGVEDDVLRASRPGDALYAKGRKTRFLTSVIVRHRMK